MITRKHICRNAGTGSEYPISKNSVQNIKHSLIGLYVLKKKDAEEIFTSHFGKFLSPISIGLVTMVFLPYF